MINQIDIMALDMPDVVILELDKKGFVKYINDSACSMFGYKKEEVLKKDWFKEFVPERVSKAVRNFYTKHAGFAKYEAGAYENPVICGDGSEILIKWYTRIIKEKGTGVVNVLSIGFDVTGNRKWKKKAAKSEARFKAVYIKDLRQREKDEAMIKAGEEKFRQLFDYAPDAYTIMDLKGRIIEANKAAERLVGYSKKELIRGSFFKLTLSPDQLVKASRELKANASGRMSGPTEYTMKCRNKALVYVEVITYPIKMAGKIRLLCIARDITLRKKGEWEKEVMRLISEQFLNTEDIESIYADLPRLISERLGYPIAAVAVYNKEKDEMVFRGNNGFTKQHEMIHVPASSSVSIEVIKNGRPIMINDLSKYKKGHHPELRKIGVKLFMAAPMILNKETIGVLLIADRVSRTDADRVYQLLQTIANFLSREISRNRVQESLKKSEEKYRIVANFTNDWEYWIDEKGVFIYCSPSCTRITGYKPDEFIADPELRKKIIFAEDWGLFKNHLEHTAGKGADVIDYRVVRKDGRMIWMSHTCTRVFSDKGDPIGIRGSDRDITDRKIIGRILSESESKFRGVFDNANDAIYLYPVTTDGLGLFIEVNKAASSILGYTREEYYAMSPLDITYKDGGNRMRLAMKKLMSVGHSKSENLFIAKDGKKVPVEVNSHVFNLGEKKLAISLARDITDRKLAEEKLKENAEKYRSLFENMEDGFAYHRIILDEKGKPLDYEYLEINRAFERITGLGRKNLIGKTARQVNPAMDKDKPDWLKIFGDVAFTGKSARFETYDGFIKKWWSILAYSDKKNYFAALYEDITERKLIEEKVTTLSAAVEQSGSIAVITDTEGTIEYVNMRFTTVTGYSKEEVTGKNMRILKSGYFTPLDYKGMWDTIKSGKEWRGQFHNKKKNGSLYWESASISPIKDDRGNITNFIAIKEDITAIKEAEEQLTQSRDMLYDFLENANDMILILRADATFEYVNKKCMDILKYGAYKLFEIKVFDIIHPDHKKDFMDIFERIINGEKLDYIDTVFMTSDGRQIMVEGNMNSLVQDEETAQVRGIFRDVTEKRKAEIEMKRSYEKLKELDIMKSNFTAMVSHELRMPLTSIKGFTSFLQGGIGGPLSEKQEEFIGIIKNNSDRLLNLINEILDISKIESGTFSITKRPMDIVAVMDNAINDISSVATKKNLEIIKQFKLEKINVGADEYRISQVVINLMNNAIKFSPERGKIFAGADAVDIENIRIPEYAGAKADKSKKYAFIWVKDQGLGIDPEHMKKIFDRYYQITGRDQSIYKGVGLGLNITKSIVEAHGGMVWVESKGKGMGSEFYALIPV
jgi:PAS domain S-box-containing protein